MKKVLWLSGHRPRPRHIEMLCDTLGDKVVLTELGDSPYNNAHTIASRFHLDKFDDMVIATSFSSPFSFIHTLCLEGVRMLQPKVVKELRSCRIDFYDDQGQGFRIARFRRIKEVAILYDD